MNRYASTLITASVCSLVLVTGCSKKAATTASKPKPPPLVYAETARQEDIANVLSLTGTVEPTRIARLASAAEGPVDSLSVREGDAVQAGQELMTIGRSEAAVADLVAAKENLAKEQEEFRRVGQLVKSGAMSGDALDAAQSRLEQARADVAQAEERNRDYRVQAPWAGLISRVFVREGFYLAPRTPLLEMFDPQSLVVRFYVPEEASMRVERAMELELTLDAYLGRTFEGQVSRIFPELDPKTRTRTVEAEMISDVQLLKGMFARLSLAFEHFEDAVTVPDAALITTQDGKSVVFVVADGTVARRVVQTGIESDGRVQVLDGVQAGEQVVTSGNEKLKDGAKVRLPAENKKAPSTTALDKGVKS